jgi:hypothetical protein
VNQFTVFGIVVNYINIGYDIVNYDFVPTLGIDKEFHDIDTVWCEWVMSIPTPCNVVDGNDQHHQIMMTEI